MGRLKMGVEESRTFNSLNAYSYSSPQTYPLPICVNLVESFNKSFIIIT